MARIRFGWDWCNWTIGFRYHFVRLTQWQTVSTSEFHMLPITVGLKIYKRDPSWAPSGWDPGALTNRFLHLGGTVNPRLSWRDWVDRNREWQKQFLGGLEEEGYHTPKGTQEGCEMRKKAKGQERGERGKKYYLLHGEVPFESSCDGLHVLIVAKSEDEARAKVRALKITPRSDYFLEKLEAL